jgi:LysR family transcriptional activator of glutamate synthase operon
MEIKQVQYFLKVAEMGSYSAAVDELYISQSSLSKQILALEKELGFLLFDRSKRKIALTPAGETVLYHAREIYQAYQEMQAEVIQYKTTPSLSIIAIPVIAQYGIATYIAQFQKAYPNIQLTLEEREAAAILPALKNHQFDLAFLRDNYLDTSQYTALEVARDKMLVVLSGKHRFAARSSLALAELVNENFIMFDKGTVVHELAVDACLNAGFEPRIFYASLRVESVLGMVASNSGIALMMEMVLKYHQRSDVIAIPLHEKIESRIVVATLKRKPVSKPTKLFMSFIKETLQPPG